MKRIGPPLIRKWIPIRPPSAHKGQFGHVLVLAGSRGMMGAARLCAAAALRSGAGLVTLGTPRGQYEIAAGSGRWEMLTLPLPDTEDGTFHSRAVPEIASFIRARDVTSLAVGPGLSLTPETVRFVQELLSSVEAPVVLDADGLNALAQGGWPARKRAPLLVTPHPGELGRLLNASTRDVQGRRPEAAREVCSKHKILCVLKGHETIVTDGSSAFVNPTGNPGLATGGTGDVLCGLIAGLIPQVTGDTVPEKMWRAALTGVYIHGLSGDLAASRTTRLGLLAGDLLDSLPAAFKKIYGSRI